MKPTDYDSCLSAPKHHAEQRTNPRDEEEINWVGVFIALIGVVLMTFSFILDGSLF